MILTGGFLNKSAGYYYYVQNIKLNKTGWESVVVKHDDNIIATFKNNNTEMNFELKQDNSYNVILMINDNHILQSRQLFKFDLDVTLTDNSNENVYEFKEGLIVDH
jgi:hypothetical protein